jgi:hypothetical protein
VSRRRSAFRIRAIGEPGVCSIVSTSGTSFVACGARIDLIRGSTPNQCWYEILKPYY